MAKKQRSAVEQLLGAFAEVKAGEGKTVLLMIVNIFLIMSSYYILKTLRDALLIGSVELFGIEGDEIKAYLPAVMSLVLIGVVPAYGLLASRVDRLRLLKITMGFVVACLLILGAWGISTGPGSAIGLTFYVWLGIVNVFLIAQFWSYANDIYTEKQGKRLFAIIAIGQSGGAALGPFVAGVSKGYTFELLVVSGIVFGVCLGLYVSVNRTQAALKQNDDESATKDAAPLAKDGGFALVFRTRYLLLIALMILVTNVVNTTGEYILGAAAKQTSRAEQTVAVVLGDEAAARVEAAGHAGEDVLTSDEKAKLTTARIGTIQEFYGNFYSLVNIIGLLIQALLVSRLFKYIGVRGALFVLPVVAFGGYAAIGIIGGLLVLRVAKTAENSTDYSLQNTVKQALFLPTSREAKYKAKAAIDTFFVRFGDTASAGIVALGLNVLAFGAREFAFVNVGLCVVWIALNVGIAREHRKMVPDDAETDAETG